MTSGAGGEAYRQLAGYRACMTRMAAAWPGFAERRRKRLMQGLFGEPVERVAENILEDLFATVLDWPMEDVVFQVGRSDIILSGLGIKRLVLEAKRPGSLVWKPRAVQRALTQARGYAAAQKVNAVAVSDGTMLYAADVTSGGLRDRVLVGLDAREPPEHLWWVSVHGIYRPCPAVTGTLAWPAADGDDTAGPDRDPGLRDPRYHLPLVCFAYAGAADDPRTWKLPYLLETGEPDTRRLPKAIQSILSNYRGARVTIPRDAVADVLVRLARTAATLRKLPCQCPDSSDAYQQAHDALEQLSRLADVGCC